MRKRLWVILKDKGAIGGAWISEEEAVKELERVTQALNDAKTGGPEFVLISGTATVHADQVVSITLDSESTDSPW